MIIDALQFLSTQFNNTTPVNGPKVELGNIARYNDGDEFNKLLDEKVLLSVINVEEDTVVRQVEHFKKEDNKILFKNPPIYLNLTVMLAATHKDYTSALIALESIVLFFQQNPYYAADRSAALATYNSLNHVNIEKITFEMVNLGLEQLHQLWSGLGGHYMPSVIYKMRMLQLDAAVITRSEPVKEIRIDTYLKQQQS